MNLPITQGSMEQGPSLLQYFGLQHQKSLWKAEAGSFELLQLRQTWHPGSSAALPPAERSRSSWGDSLRWPPSPLRSRSDLGFLIMFVDELPGICVFFPIQSQNDCRAMEWFEKNKMVLHILKDPNNRSTFWKQLTFCSSPLAVSLHR